MKKGDFNNDMFLSIVLDDEVEHVKFINTDYVEVYYKDGSIGYLHYHNGRWTFGTDFDGGDYAVLGGSVLTGRELE